MSSSSSSSSSSDSVDDEDDSIKATTPPLRTKTKKHTTPICDFSNLQRMEDGEICISPWSVVRDILHPSQEAIGYAEVKRRIKYLFSSYKDAKSDMGRSGNWLPFILGPNNIPYLVDSHHAAACIEATGYHSVNVTLKKLCDWDSLKQSSSLSPPAALSSSPSKEGMPSLDENDDNNSYDDTDYNETILFYETMIKYNFMLGIGRPDGNIHSLPVVINPVNISKSIPATIPELKDDPWRSLSSMVRYVKDTKRKVCPSDNIKCLRGYYRKCESDGSFIPFFEFRWAYFMNDAYNQGCGDIDDAGNTNSSISSSGSNQTSLWDDPKECHKFNEVFESALLLDDDDDIENPILDQHRKRFKKAAKNLIPLCRGKAAQHYKIPESLGSQFGGGHGLPGRIYGKKTQIRNKDPSCMFPTCPTTSIKTVNGGNLLESLSFSSSLWWCYILTMFVAAFALGLFITAKFKRRRKNNGSPSYRRKSSVCIMTRKHSYHKVESDDDEEEEDDNDDGSSERMIELISCSSDEDEQTTTDGWKVGKKVSAKSRNCWK